MILEVLCPSTIDEKDDSNYAGKVHMATVKDDVHDIWKKIVAGLLGCNHFNACCSFVLFNETEQKRYRTMLLSFLLFYVA